MTTLRTIRWYDHIAHNQMLWTHCARWENMTALHPIREYDHTAHNQTLQILCTRSDITTILHTISYYEHIAHDQRFRTHCTRSDITNILHTIRHYEHFAHDQIIRPLCRGPEDSQHHQLCSRANPLHAAGQLALPRGGVSVSRVICNLSHACSSSFRHLQSVYSSPKKYLNT